MWAWIWFNAYRSRVKLRDPVQLLIHTNFLLFTDRSFYSSAKSSELHAGDSTLGPDQAIDDTVNSDTGSKAGAFMAGGGGGLAKQKHGWLEVSLTEPIDLIGCEITSTAWENTNNNPDGLIKARIQKTGT